jgi:hypothetical protein
MMFDRLFNWFRKKSPPDGPDFSAIDSREKAEALFRRGELEKLFLLPPEFGGQDVPQNYLFVPQWVVNQKSGIDRNIILPLVREGKVIDYRVTPEYQSSSFIPIAIHITASEPGEFTTTINIWGEALGRDGSAERGS